MVADFKSVFPTVHDWTEKNYADVDAGEVDLILLSKTGGCTLTKEHAARHLILIGDSAHFALAKVPAPVWRHNENCASQRWMFPRTSPAFAVLRDADFIGVDDVRDWMTIGAPVKADAAAFAAGALALSAAPADGVLGTVYVRESTGTGLAWVPWESKNTVAWILAIAAEWAELDREAFAHVCPWREQPAWLTPEERSLVETRERLIAEHAAACARYDRELADLGVALEGARGDADRGLRALLTTQDQELVSAVADVLRSFGFEVEDMDSAWGDGPKREDLRVRHPERPGWLAIVEVKGFRKSGGATNDLQKV